MKKICAIHQPQFLPWLGYLDKIRTAAVFIFLDNVQFKKNEFQNRNRILAGNQAQWLTVPVSFEFGDTIRQTGIAENVPWRRKIRGSLEQYYSHAPYFREFAPALFSVLEQDYADLAELNIATVRWLMSCFNISTPVFTASEMSVNCAHPTGRLIELCRELGADVYLSGAGGRDYLEIGMFADAGLELQFQQFQHPAYQQQAQTGMNFVPFLSAVDKLFNCGW